MAKKIILRKIPLYDLLELLEHLYNEGKAEYVDIAGMAYEQDDRQDEIIVSVRDEYIVRKEEGIMYGTANIVEPQHKEYITLEDINNLLENGC